MHLGDSMLSGCENNLPGLIKFGGNTPPNRGTGSFILGQHWRADGQPQPFAPQEARLPRPRVPGLPVAGRRLQRGGVPGNGAVSRAEPAGEEAVPWVFFTALGRCFLFVCFCFLVFVGSAHVYCGAARNTAFATTRRVVE